MTPSYTLKGVLVLLIMFNTVSEPTMCNTLYSSEVEPHLFLNDFSYSFTYYSGIQFHLRSVQLIHRGNTTLCHNTSTPIITIIKLPSDVGCKTIGKITSITENDEVGLS